MSTVGLKRTWQGLAVHDPTSDNDQAGLADAYLKSLIHLICSADGHAAAHGVEDIGASPSIDPFRPVGP